MIKNREEIKTFILTLESEFPVNDWQLDGFYFWPIIRIRLFFYLIRQVEYKDNISKISPNKESSNNWMDFLIKLKKIISFLYTPIWFARLPKKENLFIAQDAHRVNFKGKRYNRFFDTFIETYGLENKSMYFEMTGVPKHEKERGHLLYDYEKPLKAYLKRARMKSNVGSGFKNKTYRNFLAYLESLPQTKKFAPKYTEKRLSDWYYKTVIPKTDFFTKVLKRIKPKQITILCYYSENIMMLIAAANKLVIKTVEMQHGPQSPLHLCYASWKHLPVDGYQVLPRVYWCWDEQSTQTIRSWALHNELYKTITIGNPWVDYWKKSKEIVLRKEYILYSLQPKPVTIEQLFSPSILALIKSLGRIWYIRLHPRQLKDLSKIKQILQTEDVLEYVNIEEATDAPLPQLLANTVLHVTHYSGTAIEASQLQTKTVLLHPIGLQSFASLIDEKRAVYLNPEQSDFIEKFIEILQESDKNELSEARCSRVKDLF